MKNKFIKGASNLIIALFAVLICLPLTSCGNEDDFDPNNIVGKWQYRNDEPCSDADYSIVTLDFKSGGDVYFSEDYFKNGERTGGWTDSGTYYTTDYVITIHWTQEYDEYWSAEYELRDNGKTLWISENGGTNYTRVK